MPSVENGYRPSGETQSKFRKTLTAILLLPIMPTSLAFSSELKQRVREKQDHTCPETGIKTRLEIHHQLPQTFGGSDKEVNAIGLAGERDRIDAHEKYDRLVLQEGIMYDGRPINQADPEQIKDRKKWERACHKFGMPTRRQDIP